MKNYFLLIFLLLFSEFGLKSQIIEITGKVIDENNQVLPGVSVLVKNTTIGSMTENDGTFKIKFEKFNKSVLIFSYFGMKDLELKISDTLKTPLLIKMYEDTVREDRYKKRLNKIRSLNFLFNYNLTDVNFNEFNEFSRSDLDLLNELSNDLSIGLSGYYENVYGAFTYGTNGKIIDEDSLEKEIVLNKYTIASGYAFPFFRNRIVIVPNISVNTAVFKYKIYKENKQTSLEDYLGTKYPDLKFIQFYGIVGSNLDIKLFSMYGGIFLKGYLTAGAGYLFKFSKKPYIFSGEQKLTSSGRLQYDHLFLQLGFYFAFI